MSRPILIDNFRCGEARFAATDWTVRFDGASLNAFGEVVVDRSRTADGVLSILYQRRSSGTTPSPIRVLDLQLG